MRISSFGLALILAIGLPGSGDSEDLLTLLPGQDLYTSEQAGQWLITPSRHLRGASLSVEVMYDGENLASNIAVAAGVQTVVPISLKRLPEGQDIIVCRLRDGTQFVTNASVVISKYPPKENEVKTDNLTGGLIVDGRPFLPFGFYCDTGDFGALAEAECVNGFNMISSYATPRGRLTQNQITAVRSQMDRCAAVGMKVNYHLTDAASLDGAPQEAAIRSTVEALRDHPALLSWYIADEPGEANVPPGRLVHAYQLIKKLDPYHPIIICVDWPGTASKYLDAMDVLIQDFYPVPRFPLTKVGEFIDSARRNMKGKPVWYVPQIFGGGEHWYREPSAAEVRVMTYLALLHGGTGIQYFIRHPAIDTPKSPIVWSECQALAMQISQLAPALLSAQRAPAATCDLPQVHARAFLDRGMVYAIAVNTTNVPGMMRLQVGGQCSGDALAVFDNRPVNVAAGTLVDMIDGYGTRVYRIPSGALPEEDVALDPDNLAANPSFEEIVSLGTIANCYLSASQHANIMIDPMVARQGRQSVRITNPNSNSVVNVLPALLNVPYSQTSGLTQVHWPWWFEYQKGEKLKVSIWAKARRPGPILRLTDENLEGLPKDFPLSTNWQSYQVTGIATHSRSQTTLNFSLTGKGTAWLDLFQVVRTGNQ